MKIFVRYAPALVLLGSLTPAFAQPSSIPMLKPARDASQAIDEEYTKKIREYTTESFFNSPLTDYLPGIENRADAESRAGRYRRRARNPAVFDRSLPLHADARKGHRRA